MRSGITPLSNKGKAMKKVVKEQAVAKVKKVSKKQLLTEISELTGKTPRELDSLARANVETITWIKNLVS
jgi:hypothetical protein